VVALQDVHFQLAQRGGGCGGFDAFGNRAQPEGLGQVDDGLQDRSPSGVWTRWTKEMSILSSPTGSSCSWEREA
jgi:hypothetical protein